MDDTNQPMLRLQFSIFIFLFVCIHFIDPFNNIIVIISLWLTFICKFVLLVKIKWKKIIYPNVTNCLCDEFSSFFCADWKSPYTVSIEMDTCLYIRTQTNLFFDSCVCVCLLFPSLISHQLSQQDPARTKCSFIKFIGRTRHNGTVYVPACLQIHMRTNPYQNTFAARTFCTSEDILSSPCQRHQNILVLTITKNY